MNTRTKFIGAAVAGVILASGLTACTSDADRVSQNLSTDADQFKIQRKIVFYNGITDKYILEIDGLCSLGNNDTAKRLTVTCRTGPSKYEKHFLGLSDNVTFFAEQLKDTSVSKYHYKIIFKPENVVPNFDLETGGK